MTIKTDFLQVGVSPTAANDFILNPDGVGGLKLQRGMIVNGVPAPTQDLMAFDANGYLRTLGKPSAFRANKNGVNQSVPANASTVVTFGNEIFDLNDDFANNAWVPPAGRPVMLSGAITFLSVNTLAVIVTIFKNGVEFARGNRLDLPSAPTSSPTLIASGIDIPNGTDAYTLVAFQNGGGSNTIDGTAYNTYFSGVRL